ncbi:GntR family transcriptional regulator [Salinicoccus sesuvii]|uniref:GntR family transcriptional regulator n=1 Tax=Salinicoccus sesuvii TaxID=868281 RepID=A0ABV7N572_9STAP
MKLEMAQREVLPNSVTTILRQAILKGDLVPGQHLVQAELAEQLGVSRMPVREALKTLEMEGLITLEPHKGAVVNELTIDDIDEIYELRTMLESLALKKSIPYLTDEALEELQHLHLKMLNTFEKEEYVDLNKRFHAISFSGCKSKRVHSLMARVSHGIAKDTPYVIPGQIEKSNREHSVILKAISSKDAERAASELSNHIDRTRKDLIEVLKQQKENK